MSTGFVIFNDMSCSSRVPGSSVRGHVFGLGAIQVFPQKPILGISDLVWSTMLITCSMLYDSLYFRPLLHIMDFGN